MTLTTMLTAGVVLAFVRRKPRDPPAQEFEGCSLPPFRIVEEDPPPKDPDDDNGIDCELPAYVVELDPPQESGCC
jgi:hypothetical protein